MSGRALVLCVFGWNTNLDPYNTKKRTLVYRKGGWGTVCRRRHVEKDVAKVQDSADRSRETLKKKRRDRISK